MELPETTTTTKFRVVIKKVTLKSMRADLIFELALIPCPRDKKLKLTDRIEILLNLENDAPCANYVNTSIFIDQVF